MNGDAIRLVKACLFPAIMIFISLLLALILAESGIRLFYPQPDPIHWVENDATYGYRVKKNFFQLYRYPRLGYSIEVKTNSLGLRDREFEPSTFTDSDLTRILLVGDSFTFGHGLNTDALFGAQLEHILKEREHQVMTINTGVGGWGTIQQTHFAENHFELFKPDFIVLTFCGNDPHDDLKFKNGLVKGVEGNIVFPGKIFLKDNSHLFRFLLKSFAVIYHNFRLNQRDEQEKLDLQSATSISRSDWQRTTLLIQKFSERFRLFNPDGVLLLQATAPENENIRRHLSALHNGDDIIYVDLFDAFAALPTDSLFIPKEGHWSKRAHSISAHHIADRIGALLAGESDSVNK